MQEQAVDRLPFWGTINQSYKLAWHYARVYLKISWLWLIIIGIGAFAYNDLLGFDMDPAKMDLKNPEVMHSVAMRGILEMIPLNLFRVLVGASIAVAWHRLVLRNEFPKEKTYLRLDHAVWAYFGLAFIIDILGQVPLLINFVTLGTSHMGLGALLMLVLLIVFIPYQLRMMVMLPGKALEAPKITMVEAKQRMRGNFWRLFWGPLFCSGMLIPWEIVYMSLSKKTTGDMLTGEILYALNFVVAMLLFTPVFLSFLSLAYHHFFEEKHG